MLTLSGMSFTYLNRATSLLTPQISAGELGTSVERLEAQLSLIFRLADHWKSLLLLDEVDIFLEKRSVHDVHRNALVSVFLRELEYYPGIMFLTTNRVKEIDDAIASRIHLPLKYKALGPDARTVIWESFLGKAVTDKGAACYNRKDLDFLTRKELNGRQVGIFDRLFRQCYADGLFASDQERRFHGSRFSNSKRKSSDHCSSGGCYRRG